MGKSIDVLREHRREFAEQVHRDLEKTTGKKLRFAMLVWESDEVNDELVMVDALYISNAKRDAATRVLAHHVESNQSGARPDLKQH